MNGSDEFHGGDMKGYIDIPSAKLYGNLIGTHIVVRLLTAEVHHHVCETGGCQLSTAAIAGGQSI